MTCIAAILRPIGASRPLLGAAALAAAALIAPLAGAEEGALSATPPETMAFGGVERSFWVFDGRSDESAPAPLVLALHGVRSDGAELAEATGFDELAEAAEIVTVLPNGLDGAWNDGRLRSGRPFGPANRRCGVSHRRDPAPDLRWPRGSGAGVRGRRLEWRHDGAPARLRARLAAGGRRGDHREPARRPALPRGGAAADAFGPWRSRQRHPLRGRRSRHGLGRQWRDALGAGDARGLEGPQWLRRGVEDPRDRRRSTTARGSSCATCRAARARCATS